MHMFEKWKVEMLKENVTYKVLEETQITPSRIKTEDKRKHAIIESDHGSLNSPEKWFIY